MRHQARAVLLSVTLFLIAACNGQATAPTAALTSALPTSVVVLPTEAPSPAAPGATQAVATETPSPAVTPTATSETLPEPSIAAPTITPAFPEARITEDTIASLRMTRTIGYGEAQAAAIAPGNTLLAVATTAGVALFDLPSFQHQRFDPIDTGAYRVEFAADGQTLFVTTGSFFNPLQREQRSVSDGSVLDTQPAAFQEKALTVMSPSQQHKAAFHPPDSSPTPGIKLTKVVDNSTIYTDTVTENISFSTDSTLAALVTYNGTVQILDINTGAITALEVPAIWSVALSPDGQSLVGGGPALRFWNVLDGSLLPPPLPLQYANDTGVFDGRQRIMYSADGSILTVDGEYFVFEAGLRRGSAWNANGLTPMWDIDARGMGVLNFTTFIAAINPAAPMAAWSEDGHIVEIEQDNKPLSTLEYTSAIQAMAFSPDGTVLALGDIEGTIQLIAVNGGIPTQTLKAPGAIAGIVFSADGTHMGAKISDGTILVWQVGQDTQPIQIAETPIQQVPPNDMRSQAQFLFSADHELLIAWGPGGIRFYSLSDGAKLHELPVSAKDVALGPNRRVLAILRNDQIQLWNVSE